MPYAQERIPYAQERNVSIDYYINFHFWVNFLEITFNDILTYLN